MFQILPKVLENAGAREPRHLSVDPELGDFVGHGVGSRE